MSDIPRRGKGEVPHHVCQTCGYRSVKWLGRCPDCGEWGTMIEEILPLRAGKKGGKGRERSEGPIPISSVKAEGEVRLRTGISELDRVLGGGFVTGSVTLLGGDPGIGKSTLLLEASGRLSREGSKVLYVSGEESAIQIKLRGERLGVVSENLLIYPETSLEEILERVEGAGPQFLIIDSIQSIASVEQGSLPGSVGQMRMAADGLIGVAKRSHLPTVMVGHVTKEGALAGPKVLEHMVDTVLYFEGASGHSIRVLRATKNRFGSTNEVGVFEMREGGLKELKNPSAYLLAQRPVGVPGTTVVAALEGTRPILVEIQALAAPTASAIPRRVVTGLEQGRVSLLIAVLERRLGYNLQGHDVYLNVVGGIRVDDPGADLGAVCALASSLKDKPLDGEMVVMGEVGLTGEVRPIPLTDARIREAEKMGFKRCIIPQSGAEGIRRSSHVELVEISSVVDTFCQIF